MAVTIEPHDSVFIRVEFDDNNDAKAFSEKVSEMIPNFGIIKRNPKNYHRFKNWDGKIRYYNTRNQLLYKGLYTNLIEFCKINDIQVIDLQHENNEVIDVKYLDSLKISVYDNATASYRIIKPDQNQTVAFKTALERKHLRVQMATGSGKTLFSYCLLHYLRNKVKGKIVIVVPRQDLGNQFYNEYKAYSKFDKNFDIDDISVIHSKSKECPNNKIIFITYQTLRNFDQDFFDKVEVLIIDEAHKSANKSLRGIVEKCVNTPYKIGMSGTFEEKDPLVSDLCLQSLLGDIFDVVKQRTLIETGRASDFEGRVYLLKHRDEDIKLYKSLMNEKNKIYKLEYETLKNIKKKKLAELEQNINLMKAGMKAGDVSKLIAQRDYLKNTYIQTTSKKWGYADEVEFLNNCDARNHFILDVALKNDKGNSLVLFSRIEKHGDVLLELAQYKNKKYDANIFYIHGNTKLKPDEAKKLIETSDKRCVTLANISMVKEGWSVNNLHYLYLSCTIKDSKALTQLVGRLLRKDGTDIKTALYIIIDDLRMNDVNNYSYEHGLENIRTLIAENHPIKKKTIDLNDYFKKEK